MKYRHAFHAGNFADVHKHVTLLALLHSMQRKERGFLYFESHAGRGLYDLDAADSHHGAEARAGIGRLRSAAFTAPELHDYVQTVAHACLGKAHAYPGSPLIAATTMRPQDRAVCCELQSPECRALERAVQHATRRMRVLCTDGLAQLKAELPPVERRALVLIDPPYEDPAGELQGALAAVELALQRLAGAVVLLWYPIKDDRLTASWLRRVEERIHAPTLLSELWLHPRDSAVALNGSGLLVFNSPYQIDVRMAQWLPELGQCLDVARTGGTSMRWIVEEAT